MTRPKPLINATILLLEDDALISLDTEDMLVSLGAERVLVAHTVEEAEAIVADQPIDAAVLDLLIGRTRCEEFAGRLVGRGLPVVFASGFGGGILPDRLNAVPSVEKPYSSETLGAALTLALAAPRAVGSLPAACNGSEPHPNT